MLGPFVGVGLMRLGLTDRTIFAIGCGFIVAAWVTLGAVTLPARQRVALN